MWNRTTTLADFNLIKKLDSTARRIKKQQKNKTKKIKIGMKGFIMLPHKKTHPYELGVSDVPLTVTSIKGSQITLADDTGKNFIRSKGHIAFIKNRYTKLQINETEFKDFIANLP
jgi:hypothetical protein